MTYADALAADRAGDVTRAVELYEHALPDAPEDAWINLAVLYWQITDFGFWTQKNLSRPLVSCAGLRMNAVLDEAAQRFPGSAPVEFWKRYIAWADVGAEFDAEDCRRILRENPGYLEPAMFIFSTSQGQECEHEARQLLAECSQSRTVRDQYVVSVIESVLSQLS